MDQAWTWGILAAVALAISGGVIGIAPAIIDHSPRFGWSIVVLAPLSLVVWNILWVIMVNPPDNVRRTLSLVIGAVSGAVVLLGATEMLKAPADAQVPLGNSDAGAGATQGQPTFNVPGSGNIVTNNQSGGTNTLTITKEDNSPRRRLRDLFNMVDRRILASVSDGQTDLNVRMQPFEINNLQALITESGRDSDVTIKGYGGTLIDSTINNGSLGTTASVHEQRWVFLTIRPTILQPAPSPQSTNQ